MYVEPTETFDNSFHRVSKDPDYLCCFHSTLEFNNMKTVLNVFVTCNNLPKFWPFFVVLKPNMFFW